LEIARRLHDHASERRAPGANNVQRIRVVADKLQLPDPELAGKTVTVTTRVSLSGEVVAHQVIELEEEQADARGIVDLDRVLFEGSVQSGELLRVEIAAGAVPREAPAGEQIRFDEKLAGEPNTWIGSHAPRVSDVWRLWYRVETFEPPQQAA